MMGRVLDLARAIAALSGLAVATPVLAQAGDGAAAAGGDSINMGVACLIFLQDEAPASQPPNQLSILWGETPAAPGSPPIGPGPDYDLGGSPLSADPCFKVRASVGGFNREIGGGLGLGTLPGLPGNEPLFVLHGNRLWGGEASLGAGFVLPDKGISFDWTGLYGWGGAHVTRIEPIGGNPVAYTFGQDSFGSTGLFLGATGAQADSSVTYSQFGMAADIMALQNMYGADTAPGTYGDGWFYIPPGNDAGQNNFGDGWLQIGATGSFSHSTLGHTGTFQSLTFPGIRAEVDRMLASNSFGIGPKFVLEKGLGGGWSVTASGDAQLVYRQSELASLEAITCGPCGGLPGAFDINIADSVSGFDWAAGLNLDFGYAISPGLKLTVGGGVDVGGRDTIRARENPAEPATGIMRITATDWSLTMGLWGAF